MVAFKVIFKNYAFPLLRFDKLHLHFFLNSVVFNPIDKSPSPNKMNDKKKTCWALKI